jgi:TP901 family phage tail tape measure protein
VRNSLVARFVLTLQDRLSGPLGVIRRRIEALRQLAGRVALVGTALAGLSVAGPVREAAALEQQMRQTAITAGLSGAAVEEMMGRSLAMFQTVARATNQRVRDLAAAAGVLVAGGGRAGEVWEELVPVIARVATASGASAEDLSNTVLAMVNNLRLGPEQVEQALAGLVQAGKEGQFELRDMAREFAALTAAAAGIGLTGPRAVASLSAALQVARQGAGSAGQAATNLTEILRKMTSTDAVRNFRDMGVDLEAVMRDAATRGINPLEALIQKIREITGGDMFRVQELFADTQVLGFLRPMMQQTAEYIRIRDRAAAASPELISTDQETAMRGLAAALTRVTIAFDEFTTRLGSAAEGPVRAAGDLLFWLADTMRALDETFPGLIDNAAMIATGLIAMSAAIAGVSAVAGPLAAAVGALASPFVLAGIAIVGAALYIRAEWERFSGFFEELTQGVSNIFSGFVDQIAGLLTGDFARAADGAMTRLARLRELLLRPVAHRPHPVRGFRRLARWLDRRRRDEHGRCDPRGLPGPHRLLRGAVEHHQGALRGLHRRRHLGDRARAGPGGQRLQRRGGRPGGPGAAGRGTSRDGQRAAAPGRRAREPGRGLLRPGGGGGGGRRRPRAAHHRGRRDRRARRARDRGRADAERQPRGPRHRGARGQTRGRP